MKFGHTGLAGQCFAYTIQVPCDAAHTYQISVSYLQEKFARHMSFGVATATVCRKAGNAMVRTIAATIPMRKHCAQVSLEFQIFLLLVQFLLLNTVSECTIELKSDSNK